MAVVGNRLTYQQIMGLWVRNGGTPARAAVMAAIAEAESGGRVDAHNTTPPDDSVGLWQVNYYGGLRQERTSKYGTPDQLLSNPDAQARAAIDISGNGQNLQPWSTYTDGAYRQYLQDGTPDTNLPPFDQTPAGAGVQALDSGGGPPDDTDCLINAHVYCLLRRSQSYALIGGATLTAGAALLALGIVVLLIKVDALTKVAPAVTPIVGVARRFQRAA